MSPELLQKLTRECTRKRSPPQRIDGSRDDGETGAAIRQATAAGTGRLGRCEIGRNRTAERRLRNSALQPSDGAELSDSAGSLVNAFRRPPDR